MKFLKRRGTMPMLMVGAIALLSQIASCNTDQIGQATAPEAIAKGIAEPNAVKTQIPNPEVWTVKEGSVYDGDTLHVVRGNEELKIRLCGIDAPEKDHPMGIEARDHLRSLIDFGDGSVLLVPIETDQDGQTVAELSVPIKDPSA